MCECQPFDSRLSSYDGWDRLQPLHKPELDKWKEMDEWIKTSKT